VVRRRETTGKAQEDRHEGCFARGVDMRISRSGKFGFVRDYSPKATDTFQQRNLIRVIIGLSSKGQRSRPHPRFSLKVTSPTFIASAAVIV
jgi:hypothetical protein